LGRGKWATSYPITSLLPLEGTIRCGAYSSPWHSSPPRSSSTCPSLVSRFIDIDTGAVLGTHDGAEIFTVGQGARISGAPEKYFIVQKQATGANSGDIFVGLGAHHPALQCNAIDVLGSQFNWIHGAPPSLDNTTTTAMAQEFECEFQCRHQQRPIPCRVSLIHSPRTPEGAVCEQQDEHHRPSPLPLSSAPTLPPPVLRTTFPSTHSSSLVIRVDPLSGSVRSPVPGQTLVLYQGDVCLGGGPIRHTYSNFFT
jgi:tRNA U34 2-thiouridine synthase MnmA/TrmU